MLFESKGSNVVYVLAAKAAANDLANSSVV